MKLRDHLTEVKDMTGYDFSELINSRQEITDGIWQMESFFKTINDVKGLKQLKRFQKEWAKLDDMLDIHL